MHYIVATLHTLGVTTATRLRDKSNELRAARDRGSVTLEQVVIALGLFLIAGLVVAIPSLFGYNFLLNTTKGLITELENYASSLADRLELESK